MTFNICLHIVFIFSFLLLSFIAKAQNLVPNPSFEEYKELSCKLISEATDLKGTPTQEEFDSALYNWTLPTKIASDIWSVLVNKNCEANPLKNNLGYPKDGKNMIGVHLLINYKLRANGRSYIEVKLKEKLKEGQNYLAGGYQSLANLYGGYASNNIGMFFTREALYSDTILMLRGQPQINISQVNDSPLVWKKFTGCFTAKGEEEYLTIGNFFDDNHSKAIEILKYDQGTDFSYYLIDSVFTELIKEPIIPNVITPNGDCCNEKFEIKNMQSNMWALHIFNRSGKEVFHSSKYAGEWDGEGLSAGVYYYELNHLVCSDLRYKGNVSILH